MAIPAFPEPLTGRFDVLFGARHAQLLTHSKRLSTLFLLWWPLVDARQKYAMYSKYMAKKEPNKLDATLVSLTEVQKALLAEQQRVQAEILKVQAMQAKIREQGGPIFMNLVPVIQEARDELRQAFDRLMELVVKAELPVELDLPYIEDHNDGDNDRNAPRLLYQNGKVMILPAQLSILLRPRFYIPEDVFGLIRQVTGEGLGEYKDEDGTRWERSQSAGC